MNTKTVFGLSVAAIFAVTMIAGISGQIPFVAADDGETELKAILLDSAGNEVGEAEFEMEDAESELNVELEGATPNSVFSITIDGNLLAATITTDADGDGEVELEPSPLVVEAGNAITVANGAGLTGTFAAEDEEEELEEETEEDE